MKRIKNEVPQIRVNMDELQDVSCEYCGGKLFISGIRIKKVSSLISKTGQEQAAVINTIICINCSKEFKGLSKKEEDKENSKIIS